MSTWPDNNENFEEIFRTPDGMRILYDLITGPILNRLVKTTEERIAQGAFAALPRLPNAILIYELDLIIFYDGPGQLIIQYMVDAKIGTLNTKEPVIESGNILPIMTQSTLIKINGRPFKQFIEFKDFTLPDQKVTKIIARPEKNPTQPTGEFNLNIGHIGQIEQWLKLEREKNRDPKNQTSQDNQDQQPNN